MKSLSHSLFLILLAGFLSMQTNLQAAETSYAGNLKGVEFTGFKRDIAKGLGKIKGVKTIRITKQSGEKHTLEVITDGRVVLTRKMVVDAIADAEHYQVSTWGQKKS